MVIGVEFASDSINTFILIVRWFISLSILCNGLLFAQTKGSGIKS